MLSVVTGAGAEPILRIGEPRLAPPPRSPPISKRLAGRWTGTLTADGKHVTIGLAMANQPDGRATGTLRSDDLELPIAITETGARVRIEVPSVSGAFAGELDATGARLVGTWSQRSVSLPLTFRHIKNVFDEGELSLEANCGKICLSSM